MDSCIPSINRCGLAGEGVPVHAVAAAEEDPLRLGVRGSCLHAGTGLSKTWLGRSVAEPQANGSMRSVFRNV